jgi:hypothetical protein
MKYIFILFGLLLIADTTKGQIHVTGMVKDSLTGEALIGANIRFNDKMVQSNKYGYFAFTTPAQTVILNVSFIGYKNAISIVGISKDTNIVIQLQPSSNELNEVAVKANTDYVFIDNMAGSFKIPVSITKKLPAFLGETDVLKTIQTLPGVSVGTESTVGLNVRGGTTDQNLILLDGVPVYNINHLFGFFSVFNTDAIANIDFFKGNIPARYSGRASSVLDISMKEGNNKKITGNLSIGPITTKGLIEVPVIKEKASLLVSFRHTWLDVLPKLINSSLPSYRFYDLNTKFNYKINNRNSFYMSYYSGLDSYRLASTDDDTKTSYSFNWGNQTLSTRYTSVLSKKLFSSVLLYYTKYDFEVENRIQSPRGNFSSRVGSDIYDLGARLELDQYFKNNQSKAGIAVIRHSFRPDIMQRSDIELPDSNKPAENILEITGFYETQLNIGKKISFFSGISQSNYQTKDKWYVNFEPRISGNYKLNNNQSIKASYNYLTQFLHLLSNGSLSLPTDLWVPITPQIKPLKAHNYSLGYYYSMPEKPFQLIIEAYYKKMYNVIDYKDNAIFLDNTTANWDDNVSVGTGQSYGLELFLQKTSGKTKGWLSYTLAWSERQFKDINQGEKFPFKYDRRHNLNLALMHDFTPSKKLSANFVLTSGAVITLPTGKFQAPLPPLPTNNLDVYNNFLYYFSQLNYIPVRNNFRMPLYHRLDVSYKFSKQKKKGIRTWSLSVYNLYSKRNAFYVYYNKGLLKQVTLFPIIPNISYEFSFF